eukprot:5249828-Amphidinium_carterae.1
MQEDLLDELSHHRGVPTIVGGDWNEDWNESCGSHFLSRTLCAHSWSRPVHVDTSRTQLVDATYESGGVSSLIDWFLLSGHFSCCTVQEVQAVPGYQHSAVTVRIQGVMNARQGKVLPHPPKFDFAAFGPTCVDWKVVSDQVRTHLKAQDIDAACSTIVENLHREACDRSTKSPRQFTYGFRPTVWRSRARLTTMGEESVCFAKVARMARRLHDWGVNPTQKLRDKIVRDVPRAVGLFKVSFAVTDQ